MADHLAQDVFPAHHVGLLHGRMSPDAKDAVMRRFARGEIDVLVATSVVEVGIDVPNATVMVIEHPERFGLAQLHQLAVQLHADAPAHADDHRLAVHRLEPLLEVLDDVPGHQRQPLLGADHRLELRPLGLELLLALDLLALGGLLELGVDPWALGLL